MRAHICLAVLAAGCGGESTGPGDLAPATTIRIDNLADTILLGETRSLRATVRGPEGQILADRPVAWSSSDPSMITISRGGVVEALARGTATILASSGDADTNASIHARRLRFEQMFTGTGVNCGLEASGEAWCWGAVGPQGSGNGSVDRTRSDLPLRAARNSRFTTLAIGGNFICGLELTQTVLCWGENEQGQLGNGSTNRAALPEPVSGMNGARAIAAGGLHACALVGTSVHCWGDNKFGQLGDGTRIRRTSPVQVTGIGPATSLALGYAHTCTAVEGRPFCWGSDHIGQLGHDTAYIRPTPARGGLDPLGPLPFTKITASFNHSCGLITGGAVYCWGYQEYPNDFTQLNHSPVQPTPGHAFADLYNGRSIQCGLKNDSKLWCWGLLLHPVQAPAPTPVVDAAVSDATVCMLDAAGAARCWNPVYGAGQAPALVQNAPAFTSIAASSDRICGLSGTGELWCWDQWRSWEPGFAAAAVVSPGQEFATIWDGDGGVCALTPAGATWCTSHWDAASGASGLSLAAVTSSWIHACGLTAGGEAWCWGRNDEGQLGDGGTTDRLVAVPVAGGHHFISIAAGESHTCGVTSGREVFCWGSTARGQMGDDSGMDSPIPVPVDGSPGAASVSSGGGEFTCAHDPAGLAHCWPVNWERVVRTVAGPGAWSTVTAGSYFACGLDAAGTAYCWGRNFGGVFGNGQQAYEEQWSPQPVSGGIRFGTLAAGQGNVCGISTDGTAYCWGVNDHGSVGSPTPRDAGAVGLPAKLYGQ